MDSLTVHHSLSLGNAFNLRFLFVVALPMTTIRWQSTIVILLHPLVAWGQFYPFCTDGISKADFAINQPVEVILAQAPLFSTNPKFGEKLKYFHLFHTAIILAQGSGAERHYWTLEFDFTGGNLVKALAPRFTPTASSPGGTDMIWDTDARFCLENGLKWGRDHWSKRFQSVTNVSATQAQKSFDFVAVVNSTTHGTHPQYQLWRVAKLGFFGRIEQTFVEDVTCNNGAIWFLHHLSAVQGAVLVEGFEFKATSTILKAHRVERVRLDDEQQVKRMTSYFRDVRDVVASNSSSLHKFLDIAKWTVERKFVYDANTKVYYELFGSFMPWIDFEYTSFPLTGPPWLNTVVV